MLAGGDIGIAIRAAVPVRDLFGSAQLASSAPLRFTAMVVPDEVVDAEKQGGNLEIHYIFIAPRFRRLV